MVKIEEVEQKLAGLAVLAVTNDPSSGSLVELGEWVKLQRPVRNPDSHLEAAELQRFGVDVHQVLLGA